MTEYPAHEKKKKKKTSAARREGAQQGNCQRTKKGESSRLPKNEPLTGTLGAPSPATEPTIPYRSGDTGEEILGKEHKEKAKKQRSPQRGTRCGELSSPPVSEVLQERE